MNRVRDVELGMVRASASALEVRHKSGAKPIDYLKAFLPIARALAFATHDDSWGEFEKEFSIIVCALIDAKARIAELEAARK